MNTENNKIIAEFMGANSFREYADKDIFSYEMYGIIECIEDGEDEQHFFLPEQMLFSSDWNWLMEVVEKCFSIEHNYYYHKNIEDALIYNSKNRIEAVYQACIEFIEVYNESSKQESCISIRDLNFSAQNKI